LIEENPEYEDRQQVIDIYYALGRVSYYYTQPEQALTYFRRMSIAAQEMRDVAQDAFAVTMMGRVISLQGFFQEALTLLDASETLAQLKRWTDWNINQAYIAFCRVYMGDETGLQLGLEVIEHAQSLNHANVQAISTVFQGMSCWQAERYEDALRYTTETITIARASGDQQPLHLAYGFRAWTHSRMGRQDEAWADFKEYERHVHAAGGRLVCADWFAAARAELLYNTGYIGDAIAQAQVAVDIAEDVGGVFACGIAHRVWAQALATRDDTPWEEIEQHLQSSLENLITSDAHFEMEHTRRVWDALIAP
jgi:tetratricopeptide (TPR) repeat protein